MADSGFLLFCFLLLSTSFGVGCLLAAVTGRREGCLGPGLLLAGVLGGVPALICIFARDRVVEALHEVYILPFHWPDDAIAIAVGIIAAPIMLLLFNVAVRMVCGSRARRGR